MLAAITRKSAPQLKRAAKAALVLAVLIGGGGAWQHLASERIAARAEQARLAQLQMTPGKWEALKREAAIAAAAQAYAEKWRVEKAQAQNAHVARDNANPQEIAPGL